MSERRCPGCSSLLRPGAVHCPGCGRFRYRGLLRIALVALAVLAAVFASRLWRR